MAKKPYPKRVEVRSETSDVKPHSIDVLSILADPHPVNGDDYAVHLWYKSHGHNPRFTVSFKSISDDNENATLVVNGERWAINIRTWSFVKLQEAQAPAKVKTFNKPL